MTLQLLTQEYASVIADWLIVGIPQNNGLPPAVAVLDGAMGEQISRLRESEDFTGKLAEIVTLLDVPNLPARRVMLLGLGPSDEWNRATLNKAVMTAARQVSTKKTEKVAFVLPLVETEGFSAASQWESAATAMLVGCVGQGIYRTEPDRFAPETILAVISPQDDEGVLQGALETGEIIAEAINVVRALVNGSPGDIHPLSFTAKAEELAALHGLACEVFDEERLREEKMGALLAVARGSSQPPRMVRLEHRGGTAGAPTLYLCGKGVTFDSGGLSIKPSAGMLDMKMDMAGAATVLGAMTAIARLKLPVNIVGLMGLVENMVSGSSYKLGDVLTARNGVTIEVHNTDAEGRLVLADLLSYAVDDGADALVDLATLTGACVVALGTDIVGAFTNDQPLCNTVLSAATDRGEFVWQLPMHDHYDELIGGDVADIKNVGGKWGGAITAAKFLQRFVGKTRWVHLDIAGPAFSEKNQPHQEGGATGCMVQTLVEVAGLPWQHKQPADQN